MYVVQIGNYAWLSTFNGATCLTMSGAHATRYPDQISANEAAYGFEVDRTIAILSSTLTKAFAELAPTLPVTVIPAAELDARLAKREATGDRGEAKRAHIGTASNPADQHFETVKRQVGVTRQIYEWALANPRATKADALAKFPNANPSTVGVQFGAARKQMRG